MDATRHCRLYSVATVDGRLAKRYCGAAAAYVVPGDYGGQKPLPGDRHLFRNGACSTLGKVRTVELGTLILGGNSFLPYFGLVVTGRHGTTVLTATLGGNNYVATDIALKMNAARTRGTFTAKDLISVVPLAGWFRC